MKSFKYPNIIYRSPFNFMVPSYFNNYPEFDMQNCQICFNSIKPLYMDLPCIILEKAIILKSFLTLYTLSI